MTGISSARLRDAKILQLDNIAPTYENVKSGKYSLYREGVHLVVRQIDQDLSAFRNGAYLSTRTN